MPWLAGSCGKRIGDGPNVLSIEYIRGDEFLQVAHAVADQLTAASKLCSPVKGCHESVEPSESEEGAMSAAAILARRLLLHLSGTLDWIAALSASDVEAIDAAAEFAARSDGELSCLLLGDQPEVVAEQTLPFAIDGVFTMKDERFGTWNGDLVVASAADGVRATKARFVILSRDIATLELAPRLAARMSGASVVGVTSVDTGDGGAVLVEATAFGGAARATYQVIAPPPLILGMAARRPGSATYPPKVRRPARSGSVRPAASEHRRETDRGFG